MNSVESNTISIVRLIDDVEKGNIPSTILVQLHHKIDTFEHIRKNLVLVVQNCLLEYMQNEFMNHYQHILLASHGTIGARAAETVAFNLCSTALHHLIVVPDFWKGMLGDDWLNNAITQIRYGKYLEKELEQEIQENIKRVDALAKEQQITYGYEFMLGKPAECLLKVAKSSDFDLVVMGSPRPKHESGLKSRMHCETLLHNLSIPLLIVPYPNVTLNK